MRRRWEAAPQARRARALELAAAVAAAVDRAAAEGAPLGAAFEAAAAESAWSARRLRNAWSGEQPGLKRRPRALWPLLLLDRRRGPGLTTEISDEAWQAFLADYLRPEAPPAAHSHRLVQRLGAARGWVVPAHPRTLLRRLDREVGRAAVILARQGAEAAAAMRPPQIRSRDDLRALEIACADGHTLDVMARWPKGMVGRPCLLGWQDIYSGAIIAWRLEETETSDGYRAAFGDLIVEWGIPVWVLLDNSRAAASKILSGGSRTRFRGRARDDDPVGIFTRLLGPDRIIWALPYHGRSKPVERAFRDLATAISRDIRLRGAWTGSSPERKPENYGERTVPIADVEAVAADAIREHNERPGRRATGGESLMARFLGSHAEHAAAIRRLTGEQLAEWLLACARATADRKSGAVTVAGQRYWAEALALRFAGRTGAQRRCVVRFDPDRLDRPVRVEELDGRLIATAEPQGSVPFLSREGARAQARDAARHRRAAKEQLDAARRMEARRLAALVAEDAAARGVPEKPAAPVVRGAFPDQPAAADQLERRFEDAILGPWKEKTG